jgi:HAD superfamily hydrolase (TIGR01509 family)
MGTALRRIRLRGNADGPTTAPVEAHVVTVGTGGRMMTRSDAISLDSVAEEWQFALDSAAEALDAAGAAMPAPDLQLRRRRLAQERREVARDLVDLAHDIHADATPWLAGHALHPASLGLPNETRTCIFDLDGVLTDSGILHAAAWADVFDDVLARFADSFGWQFVTFDRAADYHAYMDGRPRLEGIHLFLASRGIRIPEGRTDDGAEAVTAYGLARRKSDTLGRIIRRRGVTAVAGARRYLEAAGRAGVARAVVSSSTRTLPMLRLAGLATLVEARVDADEIAAGALRSRPAPDMILRACRLVDVAPANAVFFTRSPDGVAASLAAGVHVIGVDPDAEGRRRLLGLGAAAAVGRLAELLAPAIRAA